MGKYVENNICDSGSCARVAQLCKHSHLSIKLIEGKNKVIICVSCLIAYLARNKWENDLPLTLKSIDSVEGFKKHLKTHLFTGIPSAVYD